MQKTGARLEAVLSRQKIGSAFTALIPTEKKLVPEI
jgi:hypothetical protein